MKTIVAGSAFHEDLASGWSARYAGGAFRRRFEFVMRHLNALPITGNRWLDAGCGSGVFTHELARSAAHVMGVDASPAMLDQARSTNVDANVSLTLVSSLEELPYPPSAFDGALCLSVLEYVADPQACLQELHRVLRSGAPLVITVPNQRSVIRIGQWMVRCVGLAIGRNWCSYLAVSRNAFSKPAFQCRLEAAGFDVEIVELFSPYLHALLSPSGFGGLWLFVARRAGRPSPMRPPSDSGHG